MNSVMQFPTFYSIIVVEVRVQSITDYEVKLYGGSKTS